MERGIQKAAIFALLASAAFWSLLFLAPFMNATSIAASKALSMPPQLPKQVEPRQALPKPLSEAKKPHQTKAAEAEVPDPAPFFPPIPLLAHRGRSMGASAPLDAGDLKSLLPKKPHRAREADQIFTNFMAASLPPADGFDFPVGDPDGGGAYRDAKTGKTHPGWYVAVRFGERYAYGIHPAEDWNGVGLSNTDFGQPVFAVAGGRVVFAKERVKPTGGIIIIQHCYYENTTKKRIRSVYKHVDDIRVREGQIVERRQVLGRIGRDTAGRYAAHLHLELRWDESLSPTFWPSARKKTLSWIRKHYTDPSAFIRAHRRLFVPQTESRLLLVDAASGEAKLYHHGRLASSLRARFGRRAEDGRRLGLATTPHGMYFVVNKRKTGQNRWAEINFPNAYDAARGRADGLLPPHHEARIQRAWQDRQSTRRKNAGLRPFEGLVPRWDHLGLQEKDGKPVDIAPGSMVVIF